MCLENLCYFTNASIQLNPPHLFPPSSPLLPPKPPPAHPPPKSSHALTLYNIAMLSFSISADSLDMIYIIRVIPIPQAESTHTPHPYT